MKLIATNQADPRLRALDQTPGVSYRLTEHYLEVELKDSEESAARVNLYCMTATGGYLEIRFCIGDMITKILNAASTDEHVRRLYSLYPLLHEKLVLNRETNTHARGYLIYAIDPDDGQAKWFLSYGFEDLRDINVRHMRKLLGDERVQQAMIHAQLNAGEFGEDLDLSRISPWRLILRGATRGLLRGLPRGFLRTLGGGSIGNYLDGLDDVDLPVSSHKLSLDELHEPLRLPETFRRLSEMRRM